MKRRLFSWIVVLCMLCTTNLFAQTCPSGVTSTFTSTGQSCTAQGTITITSNTTTGIRYLLYDAADTGFATPLQSNTNGSFGNLIAGNYTVRVICDAVPSNVYQTLSNIKVDNLNTQINATISGITCTNYQPGGTIIANNVTGGTGSYEYKFVQTTDPNFPETTGTYQSSNTFATPADYSAFGSWQVRIRDKNCPLNYRTFSYNLQPTLRNLADFSASTSLPSTCPVNAVNFYSWAFKDSTGNPLSGWETLGMHVQVYEGTTSCTTTSKLLADQYIKSYGQNLAVPLSSTGKYFFVITTPCGDVLQKCVTPNITQDFAAYVRYDGCNVTNPKGYIYKGYDQNLQYPLTVTVTDAAGNIVYKQDNVGPSPSWTTGGLPSGIYTVTYTNSCGLNKPKTVNFTVPTIADAAVTFTPGFYNACDTQVPSQFQYLNGTTHIRFSLNSYGGVNDGQYYTVISAPDPNLIGKRLNYSGGYTDLNNALPGDYVFRLWNSCGQYKDFSYTVPAKELTNVSYTQSYQNACTANSGSVFWQGVFQYIFTGTTPIMELVNMKTGTVAYSQNYATSGSFVNVADGTYRLRLKIGNNACGITPQYVYPTNAADIVISSSTAPTFTGSIAAVCEDSTGNPTSTGSAFLNINGTGPFTVSYGLASAAPSTYTSVNNVGSTFTASGLTAYETYRFIVKDKCGNSSTTEMYIGSVPNLLLENNKQPCYNAPYTIAVRDYAGATYVIKNAAGTVLSTTRTYTFPGNYTAANDGTYTVEVTFGDCFKRVLSLKLDGTKCGAPIMTVECYKPASTTAPALTTQLGITAFQRAGSDNSNWPMVRNGGFIALESSNKGFVITRTDHNLVNNPVIGMMIYCTLDNCLEIYTSTGWRCFTTTGCPD